MLFRKLILFSAVIFGNNIANSFTFDSSLDNHCQSSRVRSRGNFGVSAAYHVLHATGNNADSSIGVQDTPRHISILNSSLQKLSGMGIYQRMGLSAETSTFQDICQNKQFVLISHTTEVDPIFNYGNEATLNAFARSYDELCVIPSRLSVIAGTDDHQMRTKLMHKVTTDGYVEGASGIRIRGDQQFLRFVDAVVWNCHDENGEYYGQACFFDMDKVEIASTASNFD